MNETLAAPTWADLSTAATVLTLLAAGTDFLLLHREKERIHQKLTRWWTAVDRSTVPNIPRLAAMKLRATIHAVLGSRLTLRTFAIGAAISWCLTTSAGNLGLYLQGIWGHELSARGFYPLEVYVINFIFDGLTVSVSIAVLGMIIDAPALKGIVLGAANLIVATALAVACAAATDWYSSFAVDRGVPWFARARETQQKWSDSFARHYLTSMEWDRRSPVVTERWRPTMGERIDWTLQSARYQLTGSGCCRVIALRTVVIRGDREVPLLVTGEAQPMNLGGILYASTTLIPTLLLFFLIASAILAKQLLSFSRSAAVRALRAAIQVDPSKDPREFMPATLSALLLVSLLFLSKFAFQVVGRVLRLAEIVS